MTAETNNSKLIAAIDLGTTKVVTLIAKASPDGKFEIISLHSTPSQGIERGSVKNINDTATAIAKTVKEVESQIGLKIKAAYVGIAGQNIHYTHDHGSMNISNGMVTADHLRALSNKMRTRAMDSNEQLLHVLPHSYMIDGVTCENPEGKSGMRLDGNFLMIKSDIVAVKAIEQCLNLCNIDIAGVMLEPLASAEAVLSDDEKKAGVALIDIGGGTTDIAIYHGGKSRYSSVVTDGGHFITNDIREAFHLTATEAEQLKVSYGAASTAAINDSQPIRINRNNGQNPTDVSQRVLAGVIQSRMESIWKCINMKINEAGYNKKLAAGIVVTGGGALLKHLPQFFKFNSGLTTRIGYPIMHLTGASNEQHNTPQYSTALGLIKMAMNEANDVVMVEKPEPKVEMPVQPEPAPAPQRVEKTKKRDWSLRGIFNKVTDTVADIADNQFGGKDQEDKM